MSENATPESGTPESVPPVPRPSARSTAVPGRGRRALPWAVAAAVLVLGYLGLAWWGTDRARTQATVAGVHLDGDAEQALAAGLAGREAAGVPVRLGDATTDLDPVAAGLTVDVAASVRRAVGFSVNPVTVVQRLDDDHDVRPVLLVDEARLDAELARVSADLTVLPQDGVISLADGTVARTEPVIGLSADLAAAPAAVQDGWLVSERIDLPAEQTPPAIDAADLDAFETEFAVPATAGPVTLDISGTPVALEPGGYAPALVVEATDGALHGSVDGARLVEIVLASGQGVGAEAHDARFEFVDGAPRIVPSVSGVGIEPSVAAAALTESFAAEGRTAQVDTDIVEPEVTTADLEAAGVVEPVSEFSTRMSGSAGRRENIQIAADTINGSYLAPGETFSMNEVLGPRTADKGYNRAPVIMNGRMTSGTGGGVSQVATTLFNGSYFAGLEDVEHKAHSLYISRYPVGREATVNYPDVDLRFTNDTPHGVLIQMWVGDGKVNTRFWSTKVYDITSETSGRYNYRSPRTITDNSASCTPQSASSGFDVTVTRIFSQNGAEVKREKMVTSYIASNRVVCGADN